MKRTLLAIILGLMVSFPAFSDHHESTDKSAEMHKGKMGKKHAKMKSRVMKKCKADLDKHCKGMEGKDAMKCLHEHESDLGTSCKKSMTKFHDKKMKMKKKHEKKMSGDHDGKMHDGMSDEKMPDGDM